LLLAFNRGSQILLKFLIAEYLTLNFFEFFFCEILQITFILHLILSFMFVNDFFFIYLYKLKNYKHFDSLGGPQRIMNGNQMSAFCLIPKIFNENRKRFNYVRDW